MAKVKMLVQTTYNKQLLRKGKVYEVADDTAARWEISRIAELADNEQTNQPE